MSDEAVLREATSEDLDELVGLWSHYIRGHQNNPAYKQLPVDALRRKRERFARLIDGRGCTILVLARADGGLDGMISCFMESNEPYFHPPTYARLQAPFVRPDARRQGNLRLLLRAATRWARSRGAAEMRLYAGADNLFANALADDLGFEAIEIVRRRALGRRDIPWTKAREDWETGSDPE